MGAPRTLLDLSVTLTFVLQAEAVQFILGEHANMLLFLPRLLRFQASWWFNRDLDVVLARLCGELLLR